MNELLNTDYYHLGDILPSFMAFPEFLMNVPISETSRILYMILLNRAMGSTQKPQQADSDGNVFLCYPISELSKDMSRSETTVKECLRSLEQVGLLVRRRQGIGRPNLLYLKRLSQNSLRQEFDLHKAEKAPTEEIRLVQSQIFNPVTGENVTESIPEPMGRYQNVYLSSEEYELLQQELPLLSEYIERLSAYMKQKNRKYSNHADTIRRWYYQDHPKRQQ